MLEGGRHVARDHDLVRRERVERAGDVRGRPDDGHALNAPTLELRVVVDEADDARALTAQRARDSSSLRVGSDDEHSALVPAGRRKETLAQPISDGEQR